MFRCAWARPKLDNYHRVRGDRGQFTSGALLTFEDNANSIKRRLWLETDRAYRAAAERLIRIKTNTQVKVAEADDSDDFSTEAAVQLPAGARQAEIRPRRSGQDAIRKLSARFQNYPSVLTSHVSVLCQTDTRYLVNTEGSRIAARPRFRARRRSPPSAKAADGTDLSTFDTFEAVDAGRPARRQGAAGGHRPRGQRRFQPAARRPKPSRSSARRSSPDAPPASSSTRSSATAWKATGRRTKAKARPSPRASAPRCCRISSRVVFDPTRRKVGGIDLNGWYDYDDEGVKARPVTAVDKGVLKTFLMSRSPIQGFDHSNGHGRRQPGLEVVSRQSQPDRGIVQRGSRGAAARRC